jgi:hypothetical protein
MKKVLPVLLIVSSTICIYAVNSNASNNIKSDNLILSGESSGTISDQLP